MLLPRVTRSRLVALALLALTVGTPAAAWTAPVTFSYTGFVTDVLDSAAPVLGPLGVAVGEPWTLTYTFESTTQDSNPSTILGIYDFGLTAVDLTVGDYHVSKELRPGDNRMMVLPGLLIYQIWIDAQDDPALNLDEQIEIFMQFSSPLGLTPTLDVLPSFPPDPSQFELALLHVRENYDPPGVGQATLFIEGQVTGIVPEPAPLLLLLLAIAGLAGLRSFGRT
jgi:hypothetical protein